MGGSSCSMNKSEQIGRHHNITGSLDTPGHSARLVSTGVNPSLCFHYLLLSSFELDFVSFSLSSHAEVRLLLFVSLYFFLITVSSSGDSVQLLLLSLLFMFPFLLSCFHSTPKGHEEP